MLKKPTSPQTALEIVTLESLVPPGHLLREIEVNVAYRWFLGLRLTDAVFDGSTLSQNRRRRYQDSTVDGRHAIITDTFTTAANVHDSIVYLGRLDRQRQRFDFDVKAVGLEDRKIPGVTGYRRPTPPKPGMLGPKDFVYQADPEGYMCPQGQVLTYATTDRDGYRHYKSDPAICRTCPLRASHHQRQSRAHHYPTCLA